MPVDPARAVTELTRLGGCATRRQLRRAVSARTVDAAVRGGAVLRVARGRYVLPLGEPHRRAAHRLGGTVSHLSAALAHGWAVKTPPAQPWVTVARHRHPDAAAREGVVLTWADVATEDARDGVTTPLRTVLDCARRLPFDEALAVADSALREGDVTAVELRTAAGRLRGPGSAQVRRVAWVASHLAANPFESVLRALLLDVPGLHLTPQLRVSGSGLWARVDLGDEGLRLAIEAEGFAFHRTRKDLVRDCHRYTELTLHGWAVLRFTWEDVMHHPAWVRWAVEGWLATRAGREVASPPRRDAVAA